MRLQLGLGLLLRGTSGTQGLLGMVAAAAAGLSPGTALAWWRRRPTNGFRRVIPALPGLEAPLHNFANVLVSFDEVVVVAVGTPPVRRIGEEKYWFGGGAYLGDASARMRSVGCF